MAGDVRSKTTTVNNGGGTSIAAAKPAGTVAGDVLVALLYAHSGSGVAVGLPSGWTLVDQEVVSGDFRCVVATKVAGGSEPSTYTFTETGAQATDFFVALAACTGIDTADPVSGVDVSQVGGGTSIGAPSVDGVEDGVLLNLWSIRRSSSGLADFNTVPNTLGGQGQTSVGAGGYSYGAWSYKLLTADGATGTQTAIADDNPSGSGMRASIALNPAADAGPNPPTVSAGPDLTVDTGSANFTITGTATPESPATIVSRSWERISGPNVVLAGTTTATVTVTPPSGAGTVVLRHTATDSNGLSASDDVSVSFVAPGQSLRPIGDVNNAGGWVATPTATPIASNVDETVASSTDYISSPDSPTAASYTMALAPGAAPSGDTGHIIEVMVWRDAAATTHELLVELLQGSTVIASWELEDLTTTPVVRQLAVAEADAADISDYTALRVRVTATVA